MLDLKDACVWVVWHLKAPLKIQHGRMQACEVALYSLLPVNGDCRTQPTSDVLPPGSVEAPAFVKVSTAKDPVKCLP